MEISEFEHAFNLCDEAAGRIAEQAYGITHITAHNHGDIALTTVHERTAAGGHRLILLATDDHRPTDHDALDDALDTLVDHHRSRAA